MRSAVPDVLAPGLRIVFCGINPGRASAAAGAHYANPRNDFWRLLHAAKLTPRLVAPADQDRVVDLGLGLTNAAVRTTAGSGDLRRADFARTAARLTKLARELQPQWLAFVGKEAYRGAFGERPRVTDRQAPAARPAPVALGAQARRLGDTRLFVLPSTSPANAAVPWLERERWFAELAGRASGLPLRPAARAAVIDHRRRILLVRFEWPDRTIWALPGGGIAAGETPEAAIARELVEEVGIRAPLGPRIWTRDHWFLGMERWAGQSELIFHVRVPRGTPASAPGMTLAQLADEHVVDQRWWTLPQLAASDALFWPRRLPALVAGLLADGPPGAPIDVGV